MLAIIIICSILARSMNGHETLADYASKNPEIAYGDSKGDSDISTEKLEADSESGSLNSKDSKSSDGSDFLKENRVVLDEGFYYDPLEEIYDKSDLAGASFDELSYCTVKYIDFSCNEQTGTIICNKAIADDILVIFRELYKNDYRIDSLDANSDNDQNNTVCFNLDSPDGSNKHKTGMAIDINPFYNPCTVFDDNGEIHSVPEGSDDYLDRNKTFPYKIDTDDLAYKLFTDHGFSWGGNFNSGKCYGHFQK